MVLLTPKQMREMDRLAIKVLRIPSLVLMENAAVAVADQVTARLGQKTLVVSVLCGPGNNGGDGMAAARHLTERGHEVTVFLSAPRSAYRGDARAQLRILGRLGIPVSPASSVGGVTRARKRFEMSDVVVDALFGTGLGRNVTGNEALLVDAVGACLGLVIAVDVPSGVDAGTGAVRGQAVAADVTVTLGWPKPGLVLFPGAEHAGEVVVADIGIPSSLLDQVNPSGAILDRACVAAAYPPRWRDTHKGIYGHLLVFAGSAGKSGAAILAVRGALRAGAGLVTAALPAASVTAMNAACPEAMTAALPETPEGSVSLKGKTALLRLAAERSAVALGPGLTQQEQTVELVRAFVGSAQCPTVVDADALNAVGADLDLLRGRGGNCVLTPHPGEMGRLMGITTEEVLRDRVGTALRCAERSGCVVVLKGARTIVASPDGRYFVNPTGNPGMASAGTGDVLTGMVGALLAMGRDPVAAASAAVYLHGAAGDLAAERVGEYSLTAGDLTDSIGPALAEILKNSAAD